MSTVKTKIVFVTPDGAQWASRPLDIMSVSRMTQECLQCHEYMKGRFKENVIECEQCGSTVKLGIVGESKNDGR